MNEQLALHVPKAGYLGETYMGTSLTLAEEEGRARVDSSSEQVLTYACIFWLDHIENVEDPDEPLIHEAEEFFRENLHRWSEFATSMKSFGEWMMKLLACFKKSRSSIWPAGYTAVYSAEYVLLLKRLSALLKDRKEDKDSCSCLAVICQIYVDLFEQSPGTYKVHYAHSLERFSEALASTSRRDRALRYMVHALRLYRQMDAEAHVDVKEDLARVLRAVGALHEFALGDTRKLDLLQEAVEVSRTLASRHRDEHSLGYLIESLVRLYDALQQGLDYGSGVLSDRVPSSIAVLQEVVVTCRTLCVSSPDKDSERLAFFLEKLARIAFELRQHATALAAMLEAAQILSRLDELYPERIDHLCARISECVGAMSPQACKECLTLVSQIQGRKCVTYAFAVHAMAECMRCLGKEDEAAIVIEEYQLCLEHQGHDKALETQNYAKRIWKVLEHRRSIQTDEDDIEDAEEGTYAE